MGAIIGAIFSIFTGFMQMNAAQDQAEAQKKEIKARQAQANVQAKNERRKAYRQAMLAQSKGEAAVQMAGGSQTSSAIGGAQAQGSVGKSNVRTINNNMQSQKMISKYQGEQADAQGEIAKWQGIGQMGQALGGAVSSMFG